MKIAICDDENEWINQIENYVNVFKKLHSDITYDVFYSGEELLKYYDMYGNIYNIAIIDIEMSGISGIETALKLRDKDNDLIIFFLTVHKEYVYDCFKPSPANFWVKPISYEKFMDDMEVAYKKLNESIQFLRITENRNRIRIKCKDIIYIENRERKSWIYTLKGIHSTNKLLCELCNELDNSLFVRVYKSYIINLAYVYAIKENELTLYNSSEIIPISRTYKPELIDKFMNYKDKENF